MSAPPSAPPALLRSIRALLVMHVQAGFNAGLRSMGALSAQASVALLVLLVTLFAGVMAVSLFVVGQDMAPRVAEGHTGLPGLLFTGATLMGPAAAVMVGEGRELDWERLRLFPLRPVALFVVELVAMFGDPVMVIVVAAQAGLAAGLVAGAPALWAPALLVFCCSVLSTAALRLVLSSLLARVLSRVRGLFLLALSLGPPVLGMLIVDQPEVVAERQLERWVEGLAVLPASVQLGLLHQARAGAWGEVALALVAPLAALGLLGALAVRGVLAEVSGQASAPSARPERLWSFTSPTWGVARLQLTTLLESEIGRFSIIAPLVWVVPMGLLTRVALPEVPAGALAPSVWFFLPSLLLGFLLNQFGLDRGAVKGLFLLPVTELQLLQGKAVGYAVFQALQFGVVVVASAVLLRPSWYVWICGPLSSAFLFVALLTVGQWTSTMWPRAIPRRGLKQAPGSMALGMVALGVLIGTMLPVGLLWAALSAWPLALCAALVAMNLAALVVFRFYMSQAARVLAGRREKLVESLG